MRRLSGAEEMEMAGEIKLVLVVSETVILPSDVNLECGSVITQIEVVDSGSPELINQPKARKHPYHRPHSADAVTKAGRGQQAQSLRKGFHGPFGHDRLDRSVTHKGTIGQVCLRGNDSGGSAGRLLAFRDGESGYLRDTKMNDLLVWTGLE